MSVSTQTLPGAPDGMVRAVAQHEIPDSAAWTIIDALIKDPGLIRRRGPLASFISTAVDAIGLVGAFAPDGNWSALLLRRSSTPSGRFTAVKNTTVSDNWGVTPSISPYSLFDSKDAAGGGVVIGTASGLGQAPTQQAVALFRGAYKTTTAATAITADIAIGATTVSVAVGTGTNFTPGHWIITDQGQLVGLVKSISTDTLTLEHPSLIAVDHLTRTIQGKIIRGIYPRVSKGRITCATTSTTVNGGDTRFKDQSLNSGTWDLFTPNYTYIGTVSAVASNTQLTLGANAAVDLLNSDYIAIRRDAGSYSQTAALVGWINASFAGRQFYAKGKALAYSDLTDPEAVFIGPEDDDTIEFSSDPISALVPTTSGLVVLTEKEAHVLAGAVGTTPDRWRGDLIHDDGTFGPMSAVSYQGGAIWAGRRGIWYWNGAEPKNIAGALGKDYQRFMAGVNSSTSRVYGMVHNDHFLLHVEAGATGIFAWYDENNTPNYLTRLTFAINLETGATTILRNVGIRGWLTVPASVGDGETYWAASTGTAAVVLKASDLFANTGNDSVVCTGDSAGPEVFVETKKYDLGDSQRLKLFKLLLLHYLLDGTVNDQASIDAGTADHLRFATVKGMDSDGVVSNTKLFVKVTPDNGDWQDKRVKFMKRSQFLAIRMWEGTDTITNLVLGAWALGFKLKRPGRV